MQEQIEKQAIEEMARKMCRNYMPNGNCAADDDPCGLECVYGYCAERIYCAGYRKQEWISVDERLPEEKPTKWKYQVDEKKLAPYCISDDVLVMAICDNGEPSFMSVGNTANGKWFIYCDDDCDPTVTHWMPLPEPPKMKGCAE